jgi:lipopolysaccharide/colanic/teichoic acid biosynthesis glycosyltransferase
MSKFSILNSVERKFLLLIVDVIIIVASLNVFVNYAIDAEFISLRLKVGVFTFGILTYLMLAYVFEFYNIEKITKKRYVASQSIYISVIYVFIVFIFAVIVYDVSFWRIPLLCFLILTPVQIAGWHIFFKNFFDIIPDTKNVLYLYDKGTSQSLNEDTALINGVDINTFYKAKLTYSLQNDSAINKKFFISAADKIDAIIINIKSYNDVPKSLEKMLLNSILVGKEVISFTTFYESTYEALPIRSHNDSFYELLQLQNKKIRYLQQIFSFLINFILCLFVGVIFVLSIPFVWILNLFFNKGPLFYTQKRVGLYGNEYKIYKFRSMVVHAESQGAKMASKNDARITPFGKILRLFRIDELPQIISVIKGDMHFIGPRPERKVFVDKLNKTTPFYNVRHLIKPGITGWAQVKYKYGENLEDSIRKLEYDFYYIKNKSIMLDLKIIFKTITTVLFSRGI